MRKITRQKGNAVQKRQHKLLRTQGKKNWSRNRRLTRNSSKWRFRWRG